MIIDQAYEEVYAKMGHYKGTIVISHHKGMLYSWNTLAGWSSYNANFPIRQVDAFFPDCMPRDFMGDRYETVPG